ncbi:MAG TPA: hypothetical protein VFT64_02700 [Rickettsiales bacterium]|nr:hypothetical protein [Rickettsiales bacterium]
MIMHLLLTAVVLICLGIAREVVATAPIKGEGIKWGVQAIAAIIAIIMIMNIWGI